MRFFKTILIAVFLAVYSGTAYSQCAMCRRVAETDQANGNKTGRGLNKGILYLLSLPYILGGIGAIAWYKNRKKD